MSESDIPLECGNCGGDIAFDSSPVGHWVHTRDGDARCYPGEGPVAVPCEDDQAAQLKERAQQAETEVERLRADLRELEVLRRDMGAVQAERDAALDDAGTARDEVERLRKEVETQGRLRRAERRDVEAQRSRADGAERARDQILAVNGELVQQAESTEAELAEEKLTARSLRTEVEKLRAELAERDRKLDVRKSQVKGYHRALETARRERDDAQAGVENAGLRIQQFLYAARENGDRLDEIDVLDLVDMLTRAIRGEGVTDERGLPAR